MAQQEGVERRRLREEYFDIMLVGMTGQGKSTTANKLLCWSEKSNVKDISIWKFQSDSEEDELRLVSWRSVQKPHLEVNMMGSLPTKCCQVLSNDTLKLRVFDMPGFYDSDAVKAPAPSPTRDGIEQATRDVANFNMGITRDIIRIQAAVGMSFRRVLYFLPCRGPLERSNAILKLDLQQLEYAFGRAVFKSMVAVATAPPYLNALNFPQECIEQCERHLTEALQSVFGGVEVPKIPIIFISISESGESILEKIREARVSCDRLVLQINPHTCAKCGMRIGKLENEEVTCAPPQDPEGFIPHEESLCHPAFKRSLLSYLWPLTKIISHWPSYKEEYCVSC